ncbi:hypothetical protein [Pseudomonas sp. PIC25]|uniref:hypothetical protein n=1 Tax=Pseudomonas sp. PIC25 TaxID=1958773 RepID=UPI00117A4389|nr:hypothetical protein [Pseudomonas sp. PIC25]
MKADISLCQERESSTLAALLLCAFVEEHLPDSIDAVYGFFRKRGAYRQFIALLDHVGQLDAWHAYEQQATEDALRDWCEENGLTLVS